MPRIGARPHKLPSGRWRIRFVDSGGHRRSKTFDSAKAAKLELLALESAAARATREGSETSELKIAPHFREFAQEFLADYVAVENKHSERLTKESILRVHLLPEFGGKRLDEIRVRSIERLKTRLCKEGHSRKTVNNILGVLRRMLRYASELEVLDRVPTIKAMKVPKASFDFLETAELEQLHASADDPEFRAMVLVAAHAGLRSGEVRALQWDDVDFNRAQLTVSRAEYRGVVDSPKGNRARVVPMTSGLREALQQIRHLKGPYVFCDPEGRIYTERATTWALRKNCRRVGMRYIGWHVLRHTFCSHLAMVGVPVKVIQEYAGHAQISTTMRYMHLSPEMLDASAKFVERAFCN